MADDSFPGWQAEKTVRLVTCEGMTRLFVKGRLYMSWRYGDEECLRLAIVQLHQCGLGTEEELATAFDRHVNSVQRYLAGFAEGGVRGLLSERGGPKGPWKIIPELRAKILWVVLGEGIGKLDAIQQRLAEDWHEVVSVPSIQQVLAENGLDEPIAPRAEAGAVQSELFEPAPDKQLCLRLESDSGGQSPRTGIGSPKVEKASGGQPGQAVGGEGSGWQREARHSYSRAQRIYLDRLEQGEDNAYAGGLLLTPLLARYRFLPTLSQVITIPTHEGYSLEELGLTLFYLDLFGFRSLEDFKRAYPEELGVLVGRAQSPSLFTLRRFLHRVRELGKGESLIEAFAQSYLQSGLAQWGVMYIDGHFMPYYGLYPITKGWHGVRQVPMKGSYNFLVVDERFTPWLFLIRSASEDLLQKIPELIEKAKRLGEQAGVSRERLDQLIVVFDREGYSAELYRYLDGRDQGEGKRRALFISWAKYADKWVNDVAEDQLSQVARVTHEIQETEEIRYLETERSMSKYGKIRAIVIQSGGNKQRSAIYTNGTQEEIRAERVVQLICGRWGEENAIKELLHKHLINYTPGYYLEKLESQPMVTNPAITKLKRKRAGLVSELNRLKVELANDVLKKRDKKDEKEKRKRRTPPRSRAEVLADITITESRILLTDQELDKLSAEVPFDQAHGGEKLHRLNHEKKRFLDGIKVFVCNLRAEMGRMLFKHYDWQKEVWPAVSMIVERGGLVRLEKGQLQVTLRRFKDREIDYAARHLCEELNGMSPETLDKFHFPIQFHVQ
jgi:hypothetical protein